jgi:hypothetical protein
MADSPWTMVEEKLNSGPWTIDYGLSFIKFAPYEYF